MRYFNFSYLIARPSFGAGETAFMGDNFPSREEIVNAVVAASSGTTSKDVFIINIFEFRDKADCQAYYPNSKEIV